MKVKLNICNQLYSQFKIIRLSNWIFYCVNVYKHFVQEIESSFYSKYTKLKLLLYAKVFIHVSQVTCSRGQVEIMKHVKNRYHPHSVSIPYKA